MITIEEKKELISNSLGKRILYFWEKINSVTEGVIIEISPSQTKFKVEIKNESDNPDIATLAKWDDIDKFIEKYDFEILPDEKQEAVMDTPIRIITNNEILVDQDIHFEYMGSHKMLEALKHVGVEESAEWDQAMENIKEEEL